MMDVIKKNIVSIVCGVVAILAICGLFWPTAAWTTQLQENLNTSKKNYADKIDSLMKAKRVFPPVPDMNNPNAEPVALGMFPTKDAIDKGNGFKSAVTEQSQKMLDAAIERNRHTPIVPFSVRSVPDSFQFQHAYDRWLALPDATIDDPKAPTIKTILQATLPPNGDEVKAEQDRIWKERFATRVYKVNDQEVNRAQIDQEFQQATANLEDTLRRQRAENFKIYMDPDALEYSHWFAPKEGRPATAEQVWYAQNMLWIDQDVADAIARINQKATNIMDAPVKQLIKISVPEDFNQYNVFRAAGSSSGASAADAAPPAPDENAMLGKAYNISETGRVCNPLYDVIQFHMEINVDARKIPLILSELQRGHLMSVYRMDTQVVDARAAVDDGGYVYGTSPVAHLWLECEELLMRGWTVNGKDGAIMPVPVQTRLGIAQPGAQ